MTECNWARERFAMLLYGELSFDDEEKVESHLDRCGDCRAALQREKAMHTALDSVEIEPSPSLLRTCRDNLRDHLLEAAPPRRALWWERILPERGALRPVAALTLVAIGFFAARVLPYTNLNGVFNTASLAGDERVRYVEPAGDGRVQVIVDETRQRVISGKLDDAPIRGLLLTAAKDPVDPGLRAEALGILSSRAQSPDIRGVLVYAIRDRNVGVREKAISGLSPYVSDPEVRSALTYVLLSDSNPGLRTEAINLLTRGTVDRETVGALQELMARGEQLGYVRERCLRVLHAVNASAETY